MFKADDYILFYDIKWDWEFRLTNDQTEFIFSEKECSFPDNWSGTVVIDDFH